MPALPNFVYDLLWEARWWGNKLSHWGLRFYCPVCKSNLRKLLDFGVKRRKNACCPVCDALERHRLAFMFLRERTDLFEAVPRRLLHVAPEPGLMLAFSQAQHLDYLSTDLEHPLAQVHWDLCDIPSEDASFDVIFCSHVLEHIPDDNAAISEMFRILSPGGWAHIEVPIGGEKTLVDPNVTTAAQRQTVYKGSDHKRLYGLDLADQLAAAGFEVTMVKGADFLAPKQIKRLAVHPNEVIFFARKPGPGPTPLKPIGGAAP